MSNEVEEPCVFLEARFKKKTLGIVVIIIVIMNMIFNYTVSTSLHVLLTCFFFSCYFKASNHIYLANFGSTFVICGTA